MTQTCGICPGCGSQLTASREATEVGMALPGASVGMHLVTCEACTRRLFRLELASDTELVFGPWLIAAGLYA